MQTQIKHLKIVAKGDAKKLASPATIKQLLTDLINSVGMVLLGEIHVWEVALDAEKLTSKEFQDEGGVTAQAPGAIIAYGTLSTSHVAIHTWPLRNEFHLDLYSCKFFNPDPPIVLIREALGVTFMQTTNCTRGTEWKKRSGAWSRAQLSALA